MEMITSEASIASIVRILGCSVVMSKPASRIASTATGLTGLVRAEPAERTSMRSPARWASHPAAIWERSALYTHRHSATGRPSFWPYTRARVFSRSRTKCWAERPLVGDLPLQGELVVAGVQEPLDGHGAERASELLRELAGGGKPGQTTVSIKVRAVQWHHKSAGRVLEFLILLEFFLGKFRVALHSDHRGVPVSMAIVPRCEQHAD